MINKLAPKEIIFDYNIKKDYRDIEFENIEEISNSYKKMFKAINIDKLGYNLYIVDSYSKDRIDNIKNIVSQIYKNKKPPRDICLCTLEDAKKPLNLIVENGKGKILKESIDQIKNDYYKAAMDFYSESYDESEKNNLLHEIEKKREQYIEELINISNSEGFEVKASKEGFAFVPIVEEKELTEDEYDSLTDIEKDEITQSALTLRKKVENTLEEIKDIEEEYNIKLREIFSEYIAINMQDKKEALFIEFINEEKVMIYIENLCEQIEKELVNNYSSTDDYEIEKQISKILNKFALTVLVNNENNVHPVVIYAEDTTMGNLFGTVEYENDNGVYTAELSSVISGDLLKAIDGCLIIRLNSLIENPLCYNALKKSLITGNMSIEGNKSYLDILSLNGLKIENININTKVILIGSLENYNILYNLDEDFRNLFKIKVAYPKEVSKNEKNLSFIKNYILDRGSSLLEFKLDNSAIHEIIKYLSRIAENRNKINVELDKIDKILLLSSEETKISGKNIISKDEVAKVVYDDELYSDKILEYYKENKVLISFEGKKVGCVNGLAIIDTGYFSCGKVIRITGVCYKGNGKIVDTQKESNMSGKIHEKSLSILSGLLANMANRYKKIEVDFHLSFEQVYSEIDGDSASVAEMICMLSALSNIGVKQNIAVTGSLNQFGEVQPIGGVNEKIEGFYKMSKLNGVEKTAVLIPSLNKNEIVLKTEVEEAVRKSKFSIYTMDTLDDAIELLLLDKEMSIKEFWSVINQELDKYS